MSLPSSLSRCQASFSPSSITTPGLFELLVPSLHRRPAHDSSVYRSDRHNVRAPGTRLYCSSKVEEHFYAALGQASSCHAHAIPRLSSVPTSRFRLSRLLSTTASRRDRILRWHRDATGGVSKDETVFLNHQHDPGGGGQPGADNETPQLRPSGCGFFDSYVQILSELSHLPRDFFDDVSRLQDKAQSPVSEDDGWQTNETWSMQMEPACHDVPAKTVALPEQLKLLSTVRRLEEKLAQTRQKLDSSLQRQELVPAAARTSSELDGDALTLSREDYKGLVDLYYYTHKNRFTPEAPDCSPTPTFLEEYSFKLSEDFAGPEAFAKYYEDEAGYESPLKEVEQILKSRHLREVSVMQKFVELLVDDGSSNRALFQVYQKLPSPGVAFLPKGIIRLFLQRMSTPAIKTGKVMLRYLSLIDDMQKAKLPINRSEWSSAIYLAGRSFGKVTQSDMIHAFRIWREMEQEAGVQASNVTFNILFDIAVRAGKYLLVDSILREMHARGLRLNRLGRVSLIYYHGLRGDGDAVRKTYRDFVDAGEIVDTLVLNCVIASLMNAGEPAAAEQTYERMKDLQQRLVHQKRADGSDLIYRRYPGGGDVHMDHQLASNSLGHVLLMASRLRKVLPDHHTQLQESMPLRPDVHTFKAMISYHANVSGDLNRLTVLMNEMVETFDIPIQAVHFQLLFKGFALHGKTRNPDTTWNVKRLELAWEICRSLLKDTRLVGPDWKARQTTPLLPSAKAAEILEDESLAAQEAPKCRKVSPWSAFVLDLASFPDDRRKAIERVHAELFDDVKIRTTRFRNPFFSARAGQTSLQESHYALGDSARDLEEGEYVLPTPAEAIQANGPYKHQDTPNGGSDGLHGDQNGARHQSDEIRLTWSLVCWLLRAYARCTCSRERVERVWHSVRLLWHPEDELQRQSVLRVLRRCLKDCDLHGAHML